MIYREELIKTYRTLIRLGHTTKAIKLFKVAKDEMSGGLADERIPADFPKETLDEGTEVELEHTDDSDIAREIAMDHLVEWHDEHGDYNYYKELKKMEAGE